MSVVTYGDAPAETGAYPYPVYRVPRGLPMPSRLALFAREVWRHGRDADLLFVNDYGLPATVANLALRKPVVMKIVGDFAWEYAVRHGLVAADEPFERFQALAVRPEGRGDPADAGDVRPGGDAGDRAEQLRAAGTSRGGARIPSACRVVHNAVDDPTAGLTEDRETIRAALGVGADERVVLVVARLTAWKGIDTVMAALGRLRGGRTARARLVVLGDGPDRPRLEGLAASCRRAW